MTKYTIREDANYGKVLQKDGKDAICPFQAPIAIPVQNQFGQQQIGFNRMPCSTICPFSEVKEDIFIIDCIGGKGSTIFTLCEEEEKAPELHII